MLRLFQSFRILRGLRSTPAFLASFIVIRLTMTLKQFLYIFNNPRILRIAETFIRPRGYLMIEVLISGGYEKS